MPYPEALQALLGARYTAQAGVISVVNKGTGGERVRDALPRLSDELEALLPEAVLFEEGANDLNRGDPSRVAQVIDALRNMIREAKAHGVHVFLGTLLPEREGGSRAGGALLIPEVNAHIRSLAVTEGATLVDLYEGFGGTPDPYIDADGLHPTELGHQKMAEIFFDAIRGTLEVAEEPPLIQLVKNHPPGRAR